MSPIPICTISETLPYINDPMQIFYALTHDRINTLLLESADIEQKQHLKSIMILESAIRITAKNKMMQMEALNENGLRVLKQMQTANNELQINETSYHYLLNFNHTKESVLDGLRQLRSLMNLNTDNPYSFFLAGLFGYDLVGAIKGIMIPEHDNDDLCFYLADTMMVIDHEQKTSVLYHHTFGDHAHFSLADSTYQHCLTQLSTGIFAPIPLPDPIVLEATECDTAQQFIRTVTELKSRISAGEFTQIVPARKFTIPCPSPFAAYAQLKYQQPSPYLFFMHDPDFILFGASPESALKYQANSRHLELYPIAGTRPRGRKNGLPDEDLDKRFELELKTDRKEIAEHMMLVDLARNDLLSVAKPESCMVADLMKIDRYTYVMHLVSRVIAQLDDKLDALDAYEACMNMGTLTGFPKVEAMKTIYEYEKEARGSYGGAIGYLNAFGDLDTCIVIRSAEVKNGMAHIRAGAGITLYSDPVMEVNETRNKAQSIISAIIHAHYY